MSLAIVDYLLKVPDSQIAAAAQARGMAALELTRGTLVPERRWHSQPDGAHRLKEACDAVGIRIQSVSATFAYEWPPMDRRARIDAASLEALQDLTEQAAMVGAQWLHVPCLEAGLPKTPFDRQQRLRDLQPLIEFAKERGIRIALETHWPPDSLRALWEDSSGCLNASYDPGSSIALGGDPRVELSLIGSALGQLRLRDRKRRQPAFSVPLGQGDVPWQDIASFLHTHSEDPAITLAATGGADGTVNYEFARRLFKIGLGADTLAQVA